VRLLAYEGTSCFLRFSVFFGKEQINCVLSSLCMVVDSVLATRLPPNTEIITGRKERNLNFFLSPSELGFSTFVGGWESPSFQGLHSK